MYWFEYFIQKKGLNNQNGAFQIDLLDSKGILLYGKGYIKSLCKGL